MAKKLYEKCLMKIDILQECDLLTQSGEIDPVIADDDWDNVPFKSVQHQ